MVALIAAFPTFASQKRSAAALAIEEGLDTEKEGIRSTVVFEGTINKSPNDPRSYRALTLANGMNVLLVTDPLAEGVRLMALERNFQLTSKLTSLLLISSRTSPKRR